MSKLDKLIKNSEKKNEKSEPENSDKNFVIDVSRTSGIQLPPVEGLENPEERDGLMLLPGQNDVSKKCWDAVKENPGIRIFLRAGYLKNTGEGKAVPIVTDWNKLAPRRAEEILEQIEDIEKIQAIKSEAKKKTLISLCEKRIDDIMDEREAENS